jgi:zinc finger CCCH domain-containing protein 15
MPKGGKKKKGGGGGGASKKQVQAKKQRFVEDKTFGLKNKNKSKKVQQYVATVSKQADERAKRVLGSNPALPRKTKKELEEERREELSIFRAVVAPQQKPRKGADAKTVLCSFFAAGRCTKGKNCKFSHDMSLQRKEEKIDLYADKRGDAAPHGAGPCKHYLDALEAKRFGWFWNCPNGDECPYMHAVPEGFVLTEDPLGRADGKPAEQTLEDKLEIERRALQGKGTPVTLERFLEWRERKAAERKAAANAAAKGKKGGSSGGAASSSAATTPAAKPKGAAARAMSGRSLFVFKPELFVDDDDAADDDDYEHDSDAEDDDVPVHVIEVTGTSITRTAVNQAALDTVDICDRFCWEPLDRSLFVDRPLPAELKSM